jgi:hypothetical protein
LPLPTENTIPAPPLNKSSVTCLFSPARLCLHPSRPGERSPVAAPVVNELAYSPCSSNAPTPASLLFLENFVSRWVCGRCGLS